MPTTVAVTGPLARPTRIETAPLAGSSSSTSVVPAACRRAPMADKSRAAITDLRCLKGGRGRPEGQNTPVSFSAVWDLHCAEPGSTRTGGGAAVLIGTGGRGRMGGARI